MPIAMNEVLTEIRGLVDRLLEERKLLQQDLSATKSELSALETRLAESEAERQALEKTNTTLKVAKSLTGTEEKTEAKLKINELVREIDKCIALLNK